MAGSTNFLPVNPQSQNQETDSQYAADTQRLNGFSVDALLPSVLLNKILFQLSTGMAALMQALANKGYSPNDANLATLTAVLQAIMTQADMTPYALLNSPAFTGTPTAPTPGVGDNSGKLATTAFLQAYATQAWVNALFLTISAAAATYAPINSPVLTGIPQTTTPPNNDNSLRIPNTNWIDTYFTSFGYFRNSLGSVSGFIDLPGGSNSGGVGTNVQLQHGLASLPTGNGDAVSFTFPYPTSVLRLHIQPIGNTPLLTSVEVTSGSQFQAWAMDHTGTSRSCQVFWSALGY